MFINETKVDLNFNLKMNRYLSGKKVRMMLAILGALLMCCAIATLTLELMSMDEEADFFMPVFSFVMAIFMFSFACFYNSVLKMTLKKMMQGKESLDRYVFTEEGYEKISKINDGTSSTASGDYNAFTEAKEYKDMLLLFINKATIFPIERAGMIEGSWEELTSLVNRKLGDKYKVFCKLK